MTTTNNRFSRRSLINAFKIGGGISMAGLASGALALSASPGAVQASSPILMDTMSYMTGMKDGAGMEDMANAGNASGLTASMVGLPYQQGDVDPKANGYDVAEMLTDFEMGTPSTLPNGQSVRNFTITATNKMISPAPGKTYSAVVYNGRLPGPYLRATQGEHIRVNFANNSDTPHSILFTGFHVQSTNGQAQGQTTQPVPANGGKAVYEFDVPKFGLYTYQAFTNPLANTTAKGLYGMFIVDPPQPRAPAKELAMMMTGIPLSIDPTTLTQNNDVYAVNGIAFQFMKHPIPIKMNELVRVYLVNVTEFDRINSFHLHANLFNLYRGGTSLTPDEFTDTSLLCHGQTAILEFSYKFPGVYMFHAHQAEFSDKGWTSSFMVT